MRFVSRIASFVIVAAVVALVATGNFYSPSAVVIACQIGAVALAGWARTAFAPGQFGPTPAPKGGGLIRRGPYRFVRHPMYAAALLLIWATVLSHRSPSTLLIGAAVTLAAVARILDEERRLRGRYPDYADYARSTKALLPFIV